MSLLTIVHLISLTGNVQAVKSIQEFPYKILSPGFLDLSHGLAT